MTQARRCAVLVGLLSLCLQPARGEVGLAPEAQAAADLESLWRAHTSPALSAAVMVKGRIVFSEGRGHADLDNLVPATGATVYNIGSVSKVNTVVAVMQLIEQGQVRLEDPIQKYVPSFPDKGDSITLHHLLTHTSGIRHYHPHDFPDSRANENMRPIASIEEGIKVFKDDPLLFKPGAYFFYSSYGVNLLQGVVEKATGMAFEDYMRRFVWGPAGMSSTSFDLPERVVAHRAKSYRVEKDRTLNAYYGDLSYKFASGGMLSTVEDMARLGAALNHGELLKPETIATMYRPERSSLQQFDEKGQPHKMRFEQALLWRVGHDAAGRRFVYHTGEVKSFSTALINYVGEDLVVATAANSLDGPVVWEEAVALAQLFLPGAKPAPEHRR
jgi:CubicO group peptidase (beta-lactamase class C family)